MTWRATGTAGHVAEGENHTIATHTRAGADRDVDVVVGYLDKYEKRDGAWTFIAQTGTPDAHDPSHRFFSLMNRAHSG